MVKLKIEGDRCATAANELVRARVAWEAPSLPSLSPGTVRRWNQLASWQPPETVLLARHRAHDRSHWIVTNQREPPEGYLLEYDLGVLQRHEQPGTERLVATAKGFSLYPATRDLAPGAELLGHVEQAAFPMMNVLELRLIPGTGQYVLVAGDEDPLHAQSDFVAALGFLDGFPIEPRRLRPVRAPAWNLALLIRTTDPVSWRHHIHTVSKPTFAPFRDETLALGSLWMRPARGFVPLTRTGEGGVETSMIQQTRASVVGPRSALRWAAAPLNWTRRPRLWALRASASRTRHLVKEGRSGASVRAPWEMLGYIRTGPGDGFSPLYSARHPVLADQFVTRSTLEATDMGYAIEGLLGYVDDFGAARHRGPHEILWASRFGHTRRYVEAHPDGAEYVA